MNRVEISFGEPMSAIFDPPNENQKFLARLRKRNQTAVGTLIDSYHAKFLHLAKMFVQSEGEAEEVVQEMEQKTLEDIQKDKGQSCLEIVLFQVLTKRSQIGAGQERWGKSSHVLHQ